MCTISGIMDWQHDRWRDRQLPPPAPFGVGFVPLLPTQDEIDEFRRLLEKARIWDAEHGEPDCEMEEKKQRLLDLADELGIEIDFL